MRIRFGYGAMLCRSCNKITEFEIRENLKKCLVCLEKTSYKAIYRKRWIKGKSDPTKVDETKSPYYRTTSEKVKEQFSEIMGRMHKLTQKEYEVIQLLWEGKSTYDVAKILHISQSNVTTMLERARIKLK